METSSAAPGGEVRSPTLPLPPPKADKITMEEFIEGATRAVLRALTSELNPQPLPPKGTPLAGEGGEASGLTRLNPQPLPPITIGLTIMPSEIAEPRAHKA